MQIYRIKQITLSVTAVLLVAAFALGGGLLGFKNASFSAEAAMIKDELIEDFEKTASISDTVFASDGISSVTTESPLSGKKSLKITIDGANTGGYAWKRLLISQNEKFKMQAGCMYTFQFTYKVTEGEIPLMMMSAVNISGNSDYAVQWNMPDGGEHWQYPAATEPNTILYSSTSAPSGALRAQFVFKAGSDEALYIQNGDFGAPVQETPFTVYIDDIVIKKGALADLEQIIDKSEQKPLYVDFENTNKLTEDSPLFSEAMIKKITDQNTVSGNRSLLIENRPANWKTLIGLNTEKYILRAGNEYAVSFKYREISDVNSLQFTVFDSEGEQFVRFDATALTVVWGGETVDMRGKSLENGDKEIKITFTMRKSDGHFAIIGGCDGQEEARKNIKLMFDDFSIHNLTWENSESEMPDDGGKNDENNGKTDKDENNENSGTASSPSSTSSNNSSGQQTVIWKNPIVSWVDAPGQNVGGADTNKNHGVSISNQENRIPENISGIPEIKTEKTVSDRYIDIPASFFITIAASAFAGAFMGGLAVFVFITLIKRKK